MKCTKIILLQFNQAEIMAAKKGFDLKDFKNFFIYENTVARQEKHCWDLNWRSESFVSLSDNLHNIFRIFFENLDRRAGHEVGHVLVDGFVAWTDGEDEDERVLLGNVVDVRYGRIVHNGRLGVVP